MMETYTINSNDLEKRLDCFFYKPEFRKLEKTIRKISDEELRDYALSVTGGATPKKTQRSYYAEAGTGIPFLRVQNITEEGLDLDGCICITKKTHDGMLKRSQVKENDLVTKITGVGKMAISAVVPRGFEGNINQHLVVIKTKNKEISEVLATFLNSTIGEKLASRRSTGGTRPALDYESLKSIPIVYRSNIVQIMKDAYEKKNKKELEIKKIIESINKYILNELSFKLPQEDNRMCYTTQSNSLKDSRFDPRFYKKHYIEFEKMLDNRSDISDIESISIDVNSGSTPKARGDAYTTKEDGGVPFIRIVNIQHGRINLDDALYIKRKIHDKTLKRTQLKPNDVLLSIAGTIGLSVVIPSAIIEANINQALVKITLKENIDPHYLSVILNSPIGRFQTDRLSRPAVQANINLEEVNALRIPIPKDTIQTKIAKEIQSRFSDVEKLRIEGDDIVNKAKLQVNDIILE